MKKWLLGCLAGVLALSLQAQEPYPQLGAKLDSYLAALVGESASAQSAECDFLINTTQDSLLRQYVALKLYDHYLQSPVMGDDAVAVHVQSGSGAGTHSHAKTYCMGFSVSCARASVHQITAFSTKMPAAIHSAAVLS